MKALEYITKLDEVAPQIPSDLVNILLFITDGEARDDQDGEKIKEILKSISHYYDFVIPVGVGPYYNERELAKIKGREIFFSLFNLIFQANMLYEQ